MVSYGGGRVKVSFLPKRKARDTEERIVMGTTGLNCDGYNWT